MGVTTVSGARSITRLVRERRRQGSGGGRGRVPRELALPSLICRLLMFFWPFAFHAAALDFGGAAWLVRSGPVSKAVGAFLERFGRPPASAMVAEQHRAQKRARFIL